MVEKTVFRFSCNVFISYILFPKMQILFRKLGKRIAVFPREVDRYKLDIFPHQPFYMTHIYEHDLAWDLGNEVGARILRHPFCFCWFAGVSCWTKPSLHHHPSYKMFINMEPRHSVSSRPGSFAKWLPWRHVLSQFPAHSLAFFEFHDESLLVAYDSMAPQCAPVLHFWPLR